MSKLFDHEHLRVYEASIEFVAWLEGVLSNVKQSVAARDHISRASASVPVNIAEASGKRNVLEGKTLLADSVRMLVAWQRSLEGA